MQQQRYYEKASVGVGFEMMFCLLSMTGNKIPRPLATTTDGTRLNRVQHFDYLETGYGKDKMQYTLPLKDNFSGYCWIEPTEAANFECAAYTLARWSRRFTFTSPEVWISDRGSHFINATLKTMAEEYKILHKLTPAYSPWSNGTVERMNKDVIAAFRAMIAEAKLAPEDWPDITRPVQTVLNKAPLERLGRNADGSARTPLQVMTGIKPRRILVHILGVNTQEGEAMYIEHTRAARLIKL